MLLLNEDKAVLQQIRDSDNKTLLSGRDKNGISFLNHVFRLHKIIFGETCSACPAKISGYIQKLKNFNSSKMEVSKKSENKFKLAPGTLLVFAGTSRSYSEHNITDEIALEYLAKNPNRKTIFSKVPDKLEKLVDNYQKKQEQKASEEAKAIEEAKLLASQKVEDMKIKVDTLISNGFILAEDKFQKEDKEVSVDEVSKLTIEELNSFLLPSQVDALPAAPVPENDIKDIDVVAEEVKVPENITNIPEVKGTIKK